MKQFFVLVPILFLLLTSCGSDDENEVPVTTNQTFNLDNHTFSLLGNQGINELVMTNVYTINNISYNRSTLTLTGMNGFTESAIVSFDLYYKAGMSIAGTYTIYADEDESFFDDFLAPLDRGCLGWLTSGVIFPFATGQQIRSNNPTGTVKIIVNSPTNYTIQYTGNFRIYNDDFTVNRNVPSVINCTGNVVIN